jgi:glycosyltransferase involved in cell wall biosynthesis
MHMDRPAVKPRWPDDVTLLVKTVYRPASLNRLIESVLDRWDHPKIVVADDGDTSESEPHHRYELIRLPFDVGCSAGRNALADHCTTPLALLTDDDFVFEDRTDVRLFVDVYRRTGLDVLGAAVQSPVGYWTAGGLIRVNDRTLRKLQMSYGSIYVTIRGHTCRIQIVDYVNIFFLASSRLLRAHRWDVRLKTSEHNDYFLRIRHHLKIGTTNDVVVGHLHENNPRYDALREGRRDHYRNEFLQFHGLQRTVKAATWMQGQMALQYLPEPRDVPRMDDIALLPTVNP